MRQNDRHFPQSDTAWGIFAVDPELGTLQTEIRQIETHLATMGLGLQKVFYQEIDRRNVKPPKGELVGVRRLDGAELYLERRQLWPKQQGTTTTASAVRAPSLSRPQTQELGRTAIQTPSSYWAWSGVHQR